MAGCTRRQLGPWLGVVALLMVVFLVLGDHTSIAAFFAPEVDDPRTHRPSTTGGPVRPPTGTPQQGQQQQQQPQPTRPCASGSSSGGGGGGGGGGVGSPSGDDNPVAWDALKAGRMYADVPRRKCIVGGFLSDWDHIAHLLENTTIPFAIARYGDGERNLILGKEISQGTQAFTEDRFWFEGGESELGRDLAWSLTGHFGQQYYYGFASPIDDGAGLRWYLQHTQQLCPFITYANLFVNKNYQRTKALLTRILDAQLTRVVLIANYEGVKRFIDLYRPPADFAYMMLPDDAPHFYKGDSRRQLIGNATALARSRTGGLFLVSGGPMAKPLIAHMWNANPRNQYVDFGSSTDELLKGRKTRPYMTPETSYAQQVDPLFTVDDNDRPVLIAYDYLGG